MALTERTDLDEKCRAALDNALACALPHVEEARLFGLGLDFSPCHVRRRMAPLMVTPVRWAVAAGPGSRRSS